MAESENHKPSLLIWIAFTATSAVLLIIASVMIHYAPVSSAGTLIDEIGGALPYGLFAAVATYYLLKPRKVERPEVRELGKSILKTNVAVLVVAFSVFIGILLFMFIFLPFPLLAGIGSQVPSRPTIDVNLLDLPILNPAFMLTIVMMAVLVGAVLITTFLRTKTETPEEIAEEETGVKGIRPIPGKIIDDEYRRAIIARYVEGREIMVTQGATLHESTTPREFEGNVLEVAKTAGRDFVPLTRLFEEARFSVHSVGEPEKVKAEKHYQKLLNKKP